MDEERSSHFRNYDGPHEKWLSGAQQNSKESNYLEDHGLHDSTPVGGENPLTYKTNFLEVRPISPQNIQGKSLQPNKMNNKGKNL